MSRVSIKEDNLSIGRVNEKCINCGMCLKTCENCNNIGDSCVNCGQCIVTCPSGAIIPKFQYRDVLNIINDTKKVVVAFVSPAVRVAIGDEFGYDAGEFLEKKLVSALKMIGFDYVFDTTFGADLTVMEEAWELIERINNKKTPMFTSCCPAWVSWLKLMHPEDLELLSSCKSPIAMQAEVIRSYFKDMYEIQNDNITTVAIVPCVAKKTEASVYPKTDYVLTTKEVAMMIRELGIDFRTLKDQEFDPLMGSSSSSGLIFGASGGVSEAVLRSAYYMVNKKKAPIKFYNLEELRGEDNFKTITLDFQKFYLRVAVINKLSTLKENYDVLKNYDFVEVMACPGGCVGGAGNQYQSIKDVGDIIRKRRESLFRVDKNACVKESYMSPLIQDVYISYLSKNNVELHTKMHKRAVQIGEKKV